jgi:hypothetical protein
MPITAQPEPAREAPVVPVAQIATSAPPTCSPFDWAPRVLRPLLKAGRLAAAAQPDHAGAEQGAFESQCQDSPDGASGRSPSSVQIDGVQLSVATSAPAGKTGRGWSGNQCTLRVQLADGAGKPVELGAPALPPFNSVGAVVRQGSAAWLSLTFNGYTKEFPGGGNRVVALDLCEGRVVWQSPNSTSNGGLLLLDDYLIAPYGFTSERRSLFVLDAHSGRLVQQLPVIENICPSTRWAPNWKRGERCDAPGQKVGAANNPRIEGGLFLVDTNTGSASFQFE